MRVLSGVNPVRERKWHFKPWSKRTIYEEMLLLSSLMTIQEKLGKFQVDEKL